MQVCQLHKETTQLCQIGRFPPRSTVLVALRTHYFLKTSLCVPASKRVDWMSSFSFCAHLSSQSQLLFVHIHCRINSMHKDGNKVVLSYSSHIWTASCQSHLCNTLFRRLLAEISSLTIRHSDMTIPPSSPRGLRIWGIYTCCYTCFCLGHTDSGFFFQLSLVRKTADFWKLPSVRSYNKCLAFFPTVVQIHLNKEKSHFR